MLKLTLIFRTVLWPQAFLVQRTHFLQLKQQFTILLIIIQWKTNTFLQKGAMYELRGFFI